jgi:uncharacterized protein YcbX
MKVAALWRYPVKSMLGERCDALELEARGVRGDRAYAVRDEAGKLGSGKNTRRMRHLEGLFSHQARHDAGELSVIFPDGRAMRAEDPAIHGELSRSLGTPVRLAPESDIPHFDASPLHLLTTASLAWLRERLPAAAVDERRFRPNLVLEVSGNTPVEQHWLGRTLRVGTQVELRIVEPTERCAMTTYAQPGLAFDPAVLRCIAQQADALFGVYAEVLRPGRVSQGDLVGVA